MASEQVYNQWRRIGLFDPSLIVLFSFIGLIVGFIIVLLYNFFFEIDPVVRNFFYFLSLIGISLLIVSIIILKDIVKISINVQYIVVPLPPIEINKSILAILTNNDCQYIEKRSNLFHYFFGNEYIYILPDIGIHIVLGDWEVKNTVISIGPDSDENIDKITTYKLLIENELLIDQ